MIILAISIVINYLHYGYIYDVQCKRCTYRAGVRKWHYILDSTTGCNYNNTSSYLDSIKRNNNKLTKFFKSKVVFLGGGVSEDHSVRTPAHLVWSGDRQRKFLFVWMIRVYAPRPSVPGDRPWQDLLSMHEYQRVPIQGPEVLRHHLIFPKDLSPRPSRLSHD